MLYHTIAAVSTPHGTGGIAVIRISGDDAVKIASAMFKPMRRSLADVPPRCAAYGTVIGMDGTAIGSRVLVRF